MTSACVRTWGYILSYANRINLEKMTPHPELASSGYALANPACRGAAYLVYLPVGSTATSILKTLGSNKTPDLYLPSDSSVNVDLSSTQGELTVEWFNPGTGETIAGGKIMGGGRRSFQAPFSGDAVLYVYQATLNQS